MAEVSRGNPMSVVNRAVALAPEHVEASAVVNAPFIRNDAYGHMGAGRLNFREKISLCLASVALLPIRLVIILLSILSFYFICCIATLCLKPRGDYRLSGLRLRIVMTSGRYLARVAHRKQGNGTDDATCVVSNHVSWVDILYHVYAHPRGLPAFAAKSSLAAVPVIGFLSNCLSCMYVDREFKPAGGGGVAGIVKERMQAAQQQPGNSPLPLLFPEGTTTNGRYLLPFKTGAFLAGTPVLPVLLHYRPSKLSPAWESISGGRHVFLMLCQLSHRLEVLRLPVYYPSARERQDPKLFALNVRQLMADSGVLPLSSSTLVEKRAYHAVLRSSSLTKAE
eukprot:jgi/Mesen1/921/ME000117S00077